MNSETIKMFKNSGERYILSENILAWNRIEFLEDRIHNTQTKFQLHTQNLVTLVS